MGKIIRTILLIVIISFVITGVAINYIYNQYQAGEYDELIDEQVHSIKQQVKTKIEEEVKEQVQNIENANITGQIDEQIDKVIDQEFDKIFDQKDSGKYSDVLSGTIYFDQTWQGTILIEGDLFIPPHVEINILPGTIIEIDETDKTPSEFDIEIEADGFNDGDQSRLKSWKDKHISIFAAGDLIANGTKTKPIIFKSVKENANYLDWGSLVLTGKKAYLNNILVENNQAGISVPSPSKDIIVENSIVRNVMWGCFSIANSNGIYKNNIAENCGHEGFDINGNPKIINNTVRYSHTAVVIIDGEPYFENNTFQNEPETLEGELIYEGYTLDRSLACDKDKVWTYLNYHIKCEGESYVS